MTHAPSKSQITGLLNCVISMSQGDVGRARATSFGPYFCSRSPASALVRPTGAARFRVGLLERVDASGRGIGLLKSEWDNTVLSRRLPADAQSGVARRTAR